MINSQTKSGSAVNGNYKALPTMWAYLRDEAFDQYLSPLGVKKVDIGKKQLYLNHEVARWEVAGLSEGSACIVCV